jgi:glycosyltransferase involved in cell wall biosynthesis
MVSDANGCSLWRVFQPFAELQKQGYDGAQWGWRHDDSLGEIVHLFDAVVLCRLSWQPEDWDKATAWVDTLHRAGKAVIYEVDDDLFTPVVVKQQVESRLEWGRSQEQLEAEARARTFAINLCDGITTTTQRLATVLRTLTDKPVHVVPNVIDLAWWRAVQSHATRLDKGVTIGWAGGRRPERDLEMMAQAWGRIAARFPKVSFLVQGYLPQVIAEHVPEERLRVLPFMPIQEYPLGMACIDIGCCPLADTPFNRAKSPIKAFEYAASGAAVVASPTVYGKLIEDGWDGLIANDVDQWVFALSRLLVHPDWRKSRARRLLNKVEKEHCLQQEAWRWPAAWGQIVEAFRTPRLVAV